MWKSSLNFHSRTAHKEDNKKPTQTEQDTSDSSSTVAAPSSGKPGYLVQSPSTPPTSSTPSTSPTPSTPCTKPSSHDLHPSKGITFRSSEGCHTDSDGAGPSLNLTNPLSLHSTPAQPHRIRSDKESANETLDQDELLTDDDLFLFQGEHLIPPAQIEGGELQNTGNPAFSEPALVLLGLWDDNSLIAELEVSKPTYDEITQSRFTDMEVEEYLLPLDTGTSSLLSPIGGLDMSLLENLDTSPQVHKST